MVDVMCRAGHQRISVPDTLHRRASRYQRRSAWRRHHMRYSAKPDRRLRILGRILDRSRALFLRKASSTVGSRECGGVEQRTGSLCGCGVLQAPESAPYCCVGGHRGAEYGLRIDGVGEDQW